jgi:hypothetical protein
MHLAELVKAVALSLLLAFPWVRAAEVDINVTGNPQAKTNDAKAESAHESPKLTDELLAAFTGLLVLVTAGLIGVGFFQWRETRDTAKRQLRAYVCVKGAEIILDPRNAPKVTVPITNFGKTPAYNVRQWVSIWIAEHPLNVQLPHPRDGLGQTDAILAPGNIIFLPTRKDSPVASSRRFSFRHD